MTDSLRFVWFHVIANFFFMHSQMLFSRGNNNFLWVFLVIMSVFSEMICLKMICFVSHVWHSITCCLLRFKWISSFLSWITVVFILGDGCLFFVDFRLVSKLLVFFSLFLFFAHFRVFFCFVNIVLLRQVLSYDHSDTSSNMKS